MNTIRPSSGAPTVGHEREGIAAADARPRADHTATALAFRPAAEADLPEVLGLYAQPDMDNGRVLALEQARAVFARFARYPDYTLWLAEQNGRVVGSFALLVMDNLGHLGAPSAIVEDVVVDPACQGAGIGRQMMEFALARCREKGCYKMALSSNRKRVRAHAFYENLGFAQHGLSFLIDPERADPGFPPAERAR